MYEPQSSTTDSEPDAVTRLLAKRRGRDTSEPHQFPRSAVNYDYEFDDEHPQPTPLKHSIVRWQPPSLKAVGGLLLIFALVVAFSFFLSHRNSTTPTVVSSGEETANSIAPAQESPLVSSASNAPAQGNPNGVVVVHVVGQVHNPGVFELSQGARINDAVEKAGGVTPEADTSKVNLAATATDGAQVYIPAVGEEVVSQPVAGGVSSPPVSGPASSGIINLNTATSEQLQELPKVGPATAEKIISWRETNGGFSSVADLDNVPGIGPAMLEMLTPLVTV